MTKSKPHSPRQSEDGSILSSLDSNEIKRLAEGLVQYKKQLDREASSPRKNEILELLEKMKLELLDDVSEWLGSDIPSEDTEDYEAWQDRLHEIEQISSFADINAYLENLGQDTAEFFESWEVRFDESSGNVEFQSLS